MKQNNSLQLNSMMRLGDKLSKYRYPIFISAFVAAWLLAIYPVAVNPMINPEYYRKRQAINRDGIVQEEVQPGNMRVWSNPFGPKPDKSDDDE